MVSSAVEATRRTYFAPHHAAFKSKLTYDVTRRTREESTIQLRKVKKDQAMMKRRGMVASSGSMDETFSTSSSSLSSSSSFGMPIGDDRTNHRQHATPTVQQLSEMYQMWKVNPSSVTDDQLYQTTKAFRRLLAKETNVPVQDIVDCGAVQVFAQLILTKTDKAALLFEALWALTNVASTDLAQNVGNEPTVIPQLGQLLMYDLPHVREQAAWCLGNLAGDSVVFRDLILSTPGVMEGMIKNLENIVDESMLKTVPWACTTMMMGKTNVVVQQAALRFIPALVTILEHCRLKNVDVASRIDVMWALCQATQAGEKQMELAVTLGAVPQLVALVREFTNDRFIMIPVLRCLGNVVAGNDEMTELVVQSGIMDHIHTLLDNPSKQLRQDVCWMLSNMAAGTPGQCLAVFRAGPNHSVVRKLADFAIQASWSIRKEALWTLSNLMSFLPTEHLHTFWKLGGVMSAFTRALHLDGEVKLIVSILKSLDRLFDVCGDECIRNFEEHDGLDPLEELQNKRNDVIYDKALTLLTLYFNVEEIDQNLCPALEDESFTFGLPSKQLFPGGASSPVGPPTFDFECSPFSTGSVRIGETAQI